MIYCLHRAKINTISPFALLSLLFIVFVIFLLAIFSALLSALPSLLSSKNNSEKTLRALKWRISLSIVLLCMVLVGAYFGAWRPNGIAAI